MNICVLKKLQPCKHWLSVKVKITSEFAQKNFKKKDQSNSILGAHIYWHSKENWKKHCILLITAAANFVNEHSSFCTRSMSNTLLNHIAKKKKEKEKETVNLLNLWNMVDLKKIEYCW